MPRRAADFTISSVAVGDGIGSEQRESSGVAPAPVVPVVFAMARNAKTLFVCWSIDWSAAFVKEVPANRQVYLKVSSPSHEKLHAIEPLSGSCSVGELVSGQCYGIELGFFAPAEHWHCIARAKDATMPVLGSPSALDVAMVPFDLEFQRLVEVLGNEGSGKLIEDLARLQQRATHTTLCTGDDEEKLTALGISDEQLQATAAAREQLTKTQPATRRRSQKFGSSWPQTTGS